MLLVLWLLALLTVLVGGFGLASRTEALQGRAMRSGTQARLAAQAGIDYAMLRLQDPDPLRRWHPDGRGYRMPFDGVEVELAIVDESGKIDLNAADPALLAQFFATRGLDEDAAARLAGAVVDWRDPDELSPPGGGAESADYADAGRPYGAKNAPFDTVAELQQVLGMTPALYRDSAAAFTVFSGLAVPNPTFAQAPVLVALGLDEEQILAQLALRGEGAGIDPELDPAAVALGTGTYSIDASVTMPDGTAAVIAAVVRAGGGPGDRVYVPLSWRLGEIE
nr:type II secretion system protein GspK [Coralloluteibacterium stylophorae]